MQLHCVLLIGSMRTTCKYDGKLLKHCLLQVCVCVCVHTACYFAAAQCVFGNIADSLVAILLLTCVHINTMNPESLRPTLTLPCVSFRPLPGPD